MENGRNFACALGGGQRLVCWGSNLMGQLAAPAAGVAGGGSITRTFSVAIRNLDVGYFSACVVVETGEVWCWGNWSDEIWGEPRRIDGLPPARAVAVSTDAGWILAEAGEVWCWGLTLSGSLDAPTMETTAPRRMLGRLPG